MGSNGPTLCKLGQPADKCEFIFGATSKQLGPLSLPAPLIIGPNMLWG